MFLFSVTAIFLLVCNLNSETLDHTDIWGKWWLSILHWGNFEQALVSWVYISVSNYKHFWNENISKLITSADYDSVVSIMITHYHQCRDEVGLSSLTHWGRVTHICVVKLTIIGSDNGLSPGRRQAIIWTNAGILLIGPLRTNFIENLIGIQTFSFTKMHLKMSSAKWRPFGLGLSVLRAEQNGQNVEVILSNAYSWVKTITFSFKIDWSCP